MLIDEAAHKLLVDPLQRTYPTRAPMREVRNASQIAVDRAGSVTAAGQAGDIGIDMRAQYGAGEPVAGGAWERKTGMLRHDDSPS